MESLLAALPACSTMAVAVAVGLVVAATFTVRAGFFSSKNRRLKTPPAVPGLPVVGNLHQLKEKKPHQLFAKWAEIYGPIYTIRTGASSLVVLNSTEVAQEAMVAKFSSISTRKLSKALTLLTGNKKTAISTSDNGDYHTMTKRYILMSMLGPSAQKQLRGTRDRMVDNMLNTFHALVNDDPEAPVNFRKVFINELFALAVFQAIGEDVSSIYVEELGKVISREEIYQTTVVDVMMGVIDVDWRDFFPYLRWIPNRRFETRVLTTSARRTAVMRALVSQQKKRIARGEARTSYLDFLLAENKDLTDEQVLMLVWEAIIVAADSVLVTTEWAMYNIAKHPEKQDRLYKEIQEVCGDETVTENHLPRLPYLNAVLHETLRRHSPVPLVPPRFVHENTNLAGYDIPAGTEVVINLYGCNMNKNDWDEPEEWKPERFLDGRFETANMYKTMSFGAGRRICAGTAQAVNLASTSVARFVQEFTWKLKEGDEGKVDTVKVTAFKLHPLCAYITPRGRK
ncbi:unnamed protein product [Urochloa humidicola]